MEKIYLMKPKDSRDIVRRERKKHKKTYFSLPVPSYRGSPKINYDKTSPHHTYSESSGKGHSGCRKLDRFYNLHKGFDNSGFKKWHKKKLRNQLKKSSYGN